MENLRKPVEELSSSAKEFLDLKMEELKLRAVEGLSVSMSRIFVMLAALLIFAMIAAALTLGLVILIGDLIGSIWGGAFIMAGVFAVILVVLLLLRKKLFVDMFVRIFAITSFDDLVQSRRKIVGMADEKWNEVASSVEKVRMAMNPFNIAAEILKGTVSALGAGTFIMPLVRYIRMKLKDFRRRH